MHPSVKSILSHFKTPSLGSLSTNDNDMSKAFLDLALKVASKAPNDPETTVSLRKLLESMDAALRAKVPVVKVKTTSPFPPGAGGPKRRGC